MIKLTNKHIRATTMIPVKMNLILMKFLVNKGYSLSKKVSQAFSFFSMSSYLLNKVLLKLRKTAIIRIPYLLKSGSIGK